MLGSGKIKSARTDKSPTDCYSPTERATLPFSIECSHSPVKMLSTLHSPSRAPILHQWRTILFLNSERLSLISSDSPHQWSLPFFISVDDSSLRKDSDLKRSHLPSFILTGLTQWAIAGRMGSLLSFPVMETDLLAHSDANGIRSPIAASEVRGYNNPKISISHWLASCIFGIVIVLYSVICLVRYDVIGLSVYLGNKRLH